jgi:hypothetical protein
MKIFDFTFGKPTKIENEVFILLMDKMPTVWQFKQPPMA